MKPHVPLLALCALLLTAAGCAGAGEPASGEPAAASSAREDTSAAWTLLQSVRQESFRQAFEGLSRYRFKQYMRTVQFDDAHARLAARTRLVAHEGPHDRRTLSADSTGRFDFGFLGRFVADEPSAGDPPDLARHLVQEDPSYLSERNREAFTYRLLSDTLLQGALARVVEIRARPGEGDAQPLRLVRLYVDGATQELLAMYQIHATHSVLFEEESTLYVQIRPGPGGAYVPHTVRLATRLDLPLLPTRRFLTTSTYYDYRPAV